MSVEKGLISYLNDQSDITNSTSSRIYCPSAPDTVATLPRIVIFRVSHFDSMELKKSAGLPETRLQMEFHAQNTTAARDLADVVRPLVRGYKGSWDTYTIGRCKIDDEGDLPDDPVHGEDRGPGAYRFDLLVTWDDSSDVTTFTS